MGIVLDSSVVIDLLRGRVADESVLALEREPVMVSTVTIHEVLAGLRDGEADLTDAILESFVAVPLGSAEAGLSGRWWREYRARGVTLPLADTLIAATAAIRGVPLVTGNVRDFPMPELHLEQWPTG
ncbi:MAG: PIN domain-containing protein [Solirubrobacterales bacterium]